MRRQLLTDVVVRLERERDACLRQLADAKHANARAQAKHALLSALCAAQAAVAAMIAAGPDVVGVGEDLPLDGNEAGGAAVAGALEALDRAVAHMAAVVDGGGGGGVGSGGGGSGGSGGSFGSGSSVGGGAAAAVVVKRESNSSSAACPPPPLRRRGRQPKHQQPQLQPQPQQLPQNGGLNGLNAASNGGSGGTDGGGGAPSELKFCLSDLVAGGGAVGMAPGAFARRIVAASRAADLEDDRGAFVAWWRERTLELALLAHQSRTGAAAAAELAEHLAAMAARLSALLLARPWAAELFTLDLSLNAPAEPPPGTWERAARALAPAAPQLLLFDLLQRWYGAAAGALTAERKELAGRALADPSDLALQASVLAGLDAVQHRFKVLVAAVCVVAMPGCLTPAQLADVYLASWPHMASMPGLFSAALRLFAGGGGDAGGGGGDADGADAAAPANGGV